MVLVSSQGEEVIRIIKAAGTRGIAKKEIRRAVSNKKCDIEEWIVTFLETGEIEKCGKQNGADLYRFAK